jgi:YfiH family protein
MPLQWLTPGWPAPATVRALSTLRGGGVSTGRYTSLNLGDHVQDEPGLVAENRRRLRVAAALPAEPVWLAQVHGVRIADLDALPEQDPLLEEQDLLPEGDLGPSAPTADGAVTRAPGRICAILTADCLPVLLASESGDAVAAAHAGWRGLAAGVIEAAVGALDLVPGSLFAWLGPAIGHGHFEVGSEVRDELIRDDPGARTAFLPNARGRFMADLTGLARRRLERLGLTRIYQSGACTHADAGSYFSHRRDGLTGRQATLIWLDPAPKKTR